MEKDSSNATVPAREALMALKRVSQAKSKDIPRDCMGDPLQAQKALEELWQWDGF